MKNCTYCKLDIKDGELFNYGIQNAPMHKGCVQRYNAESEAEREALFGSREEDETEDETGDVTDYHQKAQSEEEFLYYKENGFC